MEGLDNDGEGVNAGLRGSLKKETRLTPEVLVSIAKAEFLLVSIEQLLRFEVRA